MSIARQLGIDELLWTEAMASKERIIPIKTQEKQLLWLKKQAPARGYWRYRALNFFTRVMRLPLLKAVPQLGGQVALDTERQRLTALHQAGIFVPKVMAHGSGWLLIADQGVSVVAQFKNSDVAHADKQALLTACLRAIKAVHKKGQYLSQAFVRNMVQIRPDDLDMGFIDFEDDPMAVMTLAEAQARDLLLFVDSVARFFLKDTAFFEAQIAQFIEGHDEEVVALLVTTAKRLQWITKVPFQNLLGHDYQKLKLALLALRHLAD